MSSLLYLPVSIGEAIDKLTILDIKLCLIKDKRKDDVEKEYNLLFEKLKEFVSKYPFFYNAMKQINSIIWDQMDLLRDGNLSNEEYFKLCEECIKSNDIRFRIKNKINYISNSELKEQKSYKINRAIFKIYTDENILKEIQYFSFVYDELIIITNNEFLKNNLKYDPTIIFQNDISKIEYKKIYDVYDNKFPEIENDKLFKCL